MFAAWGHSRRYTETRARLYEWKERESAGDVSRGRLGFDMCEPRQVRRHIRESDGERGREGVGSDTWVSGVTGGKCRSGFGENFRAFVGKHFLVESEQCSRGTGDLVIDFWRLVASVRNDDDQLLLNIELI